VKGKHHILGTAILSSSVPTHCYLTLVRPNIQLPLSIQGWNPVSEVAAAHLSPLHSPPCLWHQHWTRGRWKTEQTWGEEETPWCFFFFLCTVTPNCSHTEPQG